MIRATRILALGALLAAGLACHKKKPEAAPQPATPVASTPSVNEDSIARARAYADSVGRA